ncbi:MAG: AmpG family muropeptide MFS transporter [Candidatus Pelagibacterales bacterium]|jgi:PAT family beta-lactamase induction signal transducer AmpG
MQSKVNSFAAYWDRRMLRILLLGIISGFPWVLIGSALTLWLQEDGLSRSTISWAGLIFGVYAINFLWAPLIDRIRIPFITNILGHRKAWIVTMQFLILVSLIIWSFLNPIDDLAIIITFGLIIAISSASQDITIDALRIEQIGKDESAAMAAGAATAVVGWWSGYKLGGLITLLTAEWIQSLGYSNYWQISFIIICSIVILCNIGLFFIPEAGTNERSQSQQKDQSDIQDKIGIPGVLGRLISWFMATIVSPLFSFFKKNGVTIGLSILGFIFLFKIGEAFLGRMSILFYKEIGFSKSDIAFYSKGLGWITTVTFTLIGGWFAIRSGVVKALFISGAIMALTNLMFTYLAWSGKSELIFAAAVLLDDLAAAFATVAFVTFISMLVDRNYTATQYALLASIGTAGRTLMASSSGSLVDWLNGDWGMFFIITALMVIPSLVLLWFIRKKIILNEA